MSEQPTFPQMTGPGLVLGPVFIAFEVPGEPRHKARHRSSIIHPRDGKPPFIHNYPDPKTVEYEERIAQIAKIAMGARPPSERPLALLIHAFKMIPVSWPRKLNQGARDGSVLPTGKPDWDNFGKVASDAMNGICFKDDAQVVDARVIKRYDERPALRIELREFINEHTASGK